MLTAVFPKLGETKIVRLLRAFFRSAAYPVLIAVLMAVSELFSVELPVYYTYFALGTLCLMFGEDTLGIMPIVCCGYMTFSAANNPGQHPETSVFARAEGLFPLAAILVFAVVLLAGRFILCLFELPKKRFPRLTAGFVLLGAAYLLGGLLTESYTYNTVLYGLMQIASLSVFYIFFYYSVDWSNVKKHYLAVVLTAAGIGMLAEIVGMYFLPGVIVDGAVERNNLFTGWGVYNNVGCIMAMCLPAPFYLAATKKFGWAYTVLGCLFFLGVFLTQSRSSILFGIPVFIGCIVFAMLKAKGMEKLGVFIVLGAFVLAITVTLIVLHDRMDVIFASLIDRGLDDAGRMTIYEKCWETFLSSPAFGVGFYKTPGALLADGAATFYPEAPAGAFIPPRAHNTVMQLLASGGAVALLAYVLHRAETLLLFFRRPTNEKTFAFLSVSALLLTSLLDCNFFNFGPALIYSVLLVFAECTDDGGVERKKREKKRRKEKNE